MKTAFLLLLFSSYLNADIYLHNPRGSNNRLDERGRARNNGNRMFDSQNNNRGGYNVGSLYYYAGSVLPLEWTNQHSCADPNSNCEIVIQYMCDSKLRDGTSTTTIPDNPALCKNYDCNKDLRYGMHEDYNYYMDCKYRERNKGLFTADQKLRGKTAKYTRQNPGGTRRGYECPEERDHYPYWQPSPWKDIVIMTNDVKRCEYYQTESQNVKDTWKCVPPNEYTLYARKRNMPIPINKEACEKIVWPIGNVNGTKAKWTKFEAHGIKAPDCRETMWSRDNHLGNSKGGYTNKYNWTLPDIDEENCALRIRYNISTNDYESWNTNSSKNGNPTTKVDISNLVGLESPDATTRGYVFKNNPIVNPLGGTIGKKFQLRLAINTAQYGRTFQDRSHSFAIRKRPTELNNAKIINLNVRGKRGNIVQVYPAVEYDFVPNRVVASNEDYIHFQWTGSNTNPNNNDGQGLAGTDRSNVVMLEAQRYDEGKPKPENTFGHFGNNHPKHLDKVNLLGLNRKDLVSLAMLRPGQFGGEMSELDDAGTYFDLGPRKITGIGTYFYMSTRNNNFSNRSQKGKIVVVANPVAEMQIGWGGGNVILQDGSQGIWVEKDTLKGVQSIKIEEWPVTDGKAQMQSKGGSINVGDDYGSNFFAIYPMQQIAQDGKTFIAKMKVDGGGSDNRIYHSIDMKTWTRVADVEFTDGKASFQASSGGVYVARKHRNVAMIAGVTVACIVILIAVVGTIIYCRKKPEARARAATRMRNITRSLKSEV